MNTNQQNRFRNLTDALVGSLSLVLGGSTIPSRNGETRELYSYQIHIDRPQERVIMTPARGVNIFAQLAETMWVIGGRQDMKFLSRYLARATDFSDDGETWRGGYGPRLRAWPRGSEEGFIDQLEECVKLLTEDPQSRRAVMIIFDPARDFCESKDIPCNNWLHWLVRDGALNLTVGVRSNDALWGFSGINMFEWSVIQQMMAHWIGVEVGTLAYTASSFHLYERHYEKAQKIVDRSKSKTLYEFGFQGPEFRVEWGNFGRAMTEFFKLEQMISDGDHESFEMNLCSLDVLPSQDPLLRTTLLMLQIWNRFQNGAKVEELAALVNKLPECDLRLGAIDYFRRQKVTREAGFMKLVNLTPSEQKYLEWYQASPSTEVSLEEIFSVLKILHLKKTQSYGDSWKKHGEVLGVFSNITRKMDRIEALMGGAQGTSDEGIFDTLSDLCVYAGKYLTLIAGLYPSAFRAFLQSPNTQVVYPVDVDFYAHTMGFDPVLNMLLEHTAYSGHPAANKHMINVDPINDLSSCVKAIKKEYQRIEHQLTQDYRGHGHGMTVTFAAAAMCLLSGQALRILSRENAGVWNAYVSTVEGL